MYLQVKYTKKYALTNTTYFTQNFEMHGNILHKRELY